MRIWLRGKKNESRKYNNDLNKREYNFMMTLSMKYELNYVSLKSNFFINQIDLYP